MNRINGAARLILKVLIPFAAAWALLFVFSTARLLLSPMRPSASTGNTIVWSNHGYLHYITAFDDALFRLVVGAAPWFAGVIAVAVLLGRAAPFFDKR
jgi:hypothetical protein